MTTYYDSIFTALNNLLTINADDINTSNLNVSNETTMNNATIKNLTITDSLLFPLNFMWSNLINQNPLLTGTNHLVSTNFNNNITQSNGSNQLLDTDIGTISQSEESVIIQSGNQWNQLKQTQVTDLSITGVLTLPPNIVISGALYNDDLIMNNATIQQTAPPSQINTFSATDFYNGDVRMNKNLTMIGGADTLATLKNLHVEGNSNMGLIISPTITDLDSRITTNTNSITTINTNMLLKADTTYVNSQLALKANINNPTFTGNVQSTNIITTGLYIPQSSGGLHFYTLANTISNSSSRIAFSAGNVMFWDNFTPTNIQFRFGSTLITRQTFFNNGDVSITGNILNSPTISTINTNIGLKSDLSYVNAQLLLKDNIVDVNNKLLLKANLDYVDDELALKDNIVDVDAKVLNLQNQINNIEGNYNPSSDVVFQNLTVSGTITNTNLTNLINTKANLSLVSNVNNTSDLNKPVSTAQQSALNLKLNKSGDTLINPTLSGITYLNTNTYQNQNFGIHWHLAENNISSYTSRLLLASYNAMVWDNPSSTDIRIRWGPTNTVGHQFFSNGNMSITGTFTSPTITTINSNIGLKSDKTYVDNEILNLQNQIDNIEGNYNPSSDVVFQNLTVSGTITNTNLTNLINTKSNSNNPIFTGSATIPTSLTNNIYCNNQILFHTGNINTPSSRIHIGSTDSMFWDNVLNVQTFWRWGANNSVRQVFYANGDISIPGSILNCPTINSINTTINLKADKTYTDNQLLFKTDKTFTDNAISTINSQLNLKLNKTGDSLSAINGSFSGILTGPTITTIFNNILAINDNISNVNNTSDLNKPVSTAQQTALNLKANLSYVDEQLLLKDNITDVNNKLSLKVNVDNPSFSGTMYVGDIVHVGNIDSPAIQSMLLLKSDKTYVDEQLLLKDNITDVNNKLSLKDNITDVNNKLSLKANIDNPSFSGTMYVGNIVHVGTINSPAIQSLLDLKSNINNPTFTGNMTVGTSLLGGITVNGGNATASGSGIGLINARNFMSSYYSINANTTFTWDMMPGYIYCRGSTGGYIQVNLPNPAALDKIYGFVVKIVAMNNYPIRVQSTNDIRISSGDVAQWTFQDMCKTKTFICADPTGGTMQWMLSEDK